MTEATRTQTAQPTASRRAPRGRALECLIVANDASTLAHSADQHGHRAVIIDCGGNKLGAHQWLNISSAQKTGLAEFDGAALIDQLARLPDDWRALPLVYGAGFDHRPELLARIGTQRALRGNSPDILSWLADPLSFQDLAHHLGLPLAEVQHHEPESAGWLARHIGDDYQLLTTRAEHAPEAPTRYFQRALPGRWLSALFLADGRESQLLGFTEWSGNAADDLALSTAILQPRVPLSVMRAVEDIARKLTRNCSLVGFNQLALTLQGDRFHLTGFTPRPTDDIALYDEDLPGGALAAHLAAVEGELPRRPLVLSNSRGFCKLRAHSTLQIDASPAPAWARDWPQAGRVLHPGETRCTVFAEGSGHDEVRALLKARVRSLETKTPRGKPGPSL